MKMRFLAISILLATFFVWGAEKSFAQTDAQLLNNTATDLRKGLPVKLGDVEITRVITYCPTGCDQTYAASYLTLDGWTPNLIKSNVNFPQIQQSLKSGFLTDYCSDPLRQRNINLSINISDMTRTHVGTIAINPTDCPVNVTPTPNPTPNSQTSSQRHEVDVDFTTSYSPIWNDSGSGANAQVSFWRPNLTSGWSRVGHHISKGYGNPQEATMLVRPRTSGAISDPVDYTLVWTDAGSGANQNGSVWHPVCRSGYQALGDVTSFSHAKPATTEMVCVHESALVRANQGNPIWDDTGSGATMDFGSWNINPSVGSVSRGLFFGAPSHSRPQVSLWAVTSNTITTVATTPSSVEDQLWDSIKNSNQAGDFQNYLSRFPNGKFAALARLKISQNGGLPNPVATPTPVTTLNNPGSTNSNVEEQFWDAVKNSSKAQDFQGYLDNYPSGKYVSIAKLKISQLGGSITTPTNNPTTNPITPSSGNTVEDQFWDTVKNSSKAQDFQSYLSSYPNGKYASLARLKFSQLGGSTNPTATPTPITPNPTPGTSSIEQQYWDVVKNSTKAQDFQSYLKDYPNGQFAPIARLKIQQFQTGGTTQNPTNSNTEDQYWNVISNSQRVQDFQGYLSSYPSGKYAAIARLKISQLGGVTVQQPPTGGSQVEDQYWNNVKNSNRAQDFQSYLNTYPNGQYAGIARLRISQINNVNTNSPGTVRNPGNKMPSDEEFIRTAQPGSINELSQARRFFVAGEDFAVKQAIAKAIQKEIPQLEVALTEQDADFFILCNLTDSTTNATVSNDSSNPNLFGDFIVFTVVSPANAAQKRIRIQFRQKSGRSFGVFTDTPDVKLAKEFAKRLKKIIQ